EDKRVKALSVSWVQFASGARVDLAALGALCRSRGVFFVVDAIQGVGALTLDVRTTPIDILACGAQKWLLSPWGSGFLYVRQPLVEQLEPHDVSWLAVRGADDFSRLTDYELAWRADAHKFESIPLPSRDGAGMTASLELFFETGLDEVPAHTLRPSDHIVAWALDRDEVELVTPSSPSRRAGIVSIRPQNARGAS